MKEGWALVTMTLNSDHVRYHVVMFHWWSGNKCHELAFKLAKWMKWQWCSKLDQRAAKDNCLHPHTVYYSHLESLLLLLLAQCYSRCKLQWFRKGSRKYHKIRLFWHMISEMFFFAQANIPNFLSDCFLFHQLQQLNIMFF